MLLEFAPLIGLTLAAFALKNKFKESDGLAWIFTVACIIALINFALV